MKTQHFLWAVLITAAFCNFASAQENPADVLADPVLDLRRPADRAKAVGRMKIIEDRRLKNAHAKGRALGIPLSVTLPNGGWRELVDFDAEGPVFRASRNTNAAISTGANLTWTSPHTLNGAGLIVGVWDGGMGRPTHQEFATGSRLISVDGSTMSAHSMHVAGTIAAAGVNPSARGMANAAKVHSYTSSNDKSEMTSVGATAGGQTATKIYTSNHSYGPDDGWKYSSTTSKWVFGGTGTDQNAYDINFGQYSSNSRDIDSLIYSTPCLASFWACGNDRTDGPSNGNTATIGGVDVTYNSAIHPQGDGIYRGGYETINAESIGKNSIAIGAVNDAVTSGVRDISKATISSFSSTGPADDGRIKPDLVANGVSLTSTGIGSDTETVAMSGTSMASPNACGSATLLVDQYNRLFSSAMRASTLKALLIHTATDLGNPGPDYKFGWGLVDTKKAADLLVLHAANPANNNLVEDKLTTANPTQSYTFAWDGTSAIRATICWTDPAGLSETSHDNRTPDLVNNLNLKLIAPNGTEYFPYVMPFVGTWTVASMSQNATTGINNTDNVEQVYLANPGQFGVWQAVITYTGGLTNNEQFYGLLLSGLQQQADEQAPTPNPMSWASAPTPGADPQTQITMTATTATDATGVEYYFNETSGTLGGTDSGWQDSPTYTDTGLFPGTQYTYTVTARDKSANQNTTTASAPASATTSGTQDTTPPNPNPMTFASFPVANGQTSIVMTAATASDLNGVEYFFDETSGNSGGTDSGWQNSPTYEDIGLLAGTAYTYTVTARDKSPNANAGTPSSTATGYTQAVSGGTDFANADVAVSGTVTGTYTNTLSSDNSYQQLTEIESGGGPSTRYSYLEHKWSFNVTGGTTVSFNVEAYHTSNSEGDDFVFAYSTNGVNGTYTNMLTVTQTTDNNTIQSFSLPPGTSGTVHVRVLDTNQTQGNTVLDSLYIDSMYFVSGSAGGGSNPPTLVSIVDNQGGGPIEFNTQVTYTVTFSKDMDAATVTAAHFGNAGNSTVTFGTITEISPGVFTVLVTPTTTGSLQLRINAGADLRDANNIAMITTSALADDVTITVTGINAGITLSNLNQTYNGSPKPVTVTTNPVGLSHAVTYNLSATVPSNVGTYPVVATITDPNYSGSTSGSLVIAKASQTITFAPLGNVLDNAVPFALTANSTSGLAVAYASSDPAVATVSGTTVTIVGLGTTTITASQAGDANYNAATSVPQTLTVVRANPLAVTSGPYGVLISQSVTLNGSASQPSYNETISSYEWDLNNDNTFGDVTGANVDISYTTLNTTWGRVPGPNTIQLKVTDSSGKTSITSTTLTLIASLTWDANGTTANQTDGAGAWLNANQWWSGSANAAWSSSANANFGNGGAGGAVTLASATTVNSLILNSFTGTYTLGTVGNTITLNGGITKNTGSGTASIISPITLGGGQTWTNNSGTLTVSGALDTGTTASPGNYTLTFDGTGTTTASGVISGTGGIVKNGAGRVSFGTGSVANTYTGPTTVNGGILSIANNSASLGGGNLTLNGGVIGFYWSSGLTRTLGIGDNEVQILGGESGFGGDGATGPTISLGTTVVWGASGVGTATGFFNPSKFVLGSFDTTNTGLTTFSSAINLNGATRTILAYKGLSSAGNRSTISGAISNSTGTAGFTKEGNGMLFLSNSTSTWNGATTVSEGLLDMGGISLTNIGGGSGRNISVATGATLRFTALSNAILNRIVQTSDEFTLMTATTSNAMDFSSSTGANLPGTFLSQYSSNGGKVELSGVITPGGGAYRFGSAAQSGALGIKQTSLLSGANGLIIGGNRVVIVGTHTFTGDTTLRDGAVLGLSGLDTDAGVAKNNSSALQNSVLDLGAPTSTGLIFLEAGNTGGIAGLTTLANGGTQSATFGGLKGSRDLYSSFKFTGPGNNTSATTAVNITGFTLNVGTGNTVTYSGAIGGFGTSATGSTGGNSTLTKTDLGTQILSGVNTYTGATTVSAGILSLGTSGSIANSTSLAITAGATLNTSAKASYAIPGSQPIQFGVDATGSGSSGMITAAGLDISNATITYNISGTLDDAAYVLATYTNLVGSFLSAPTPPSGYTLQYAYQGNKIALVQTTGPGPVASFTISAIGSTQTVGTPITGITITAQDASNATATSFTGTVTFTGTAGISGTSANFTDGVLTGLSLTPTLVGTDRTLVVDDGSGHTGSTTFTVQTRFQDWAETSGLVGGDATFTANPDGDSLINLQEFAFGMNPTSPILTTLTYTTGGTGNPGLPILENTGTTQSPNYRAVFARRKDYLTANLTYTVEFSANLTHWKASAADLSVLTGTSGSTVEAVAIPFPLTVPLTAAELESAPPKFFRVKVAEN